MSVSRAKHSTRAILVVATACALHAVAAFSQDLDFTDVTVGAGLDYTHDYIEPRLSTRHMVLAGAAAGDYDADGWLDLYVIRGSIGTNRLYRNLGDGRFQDVSVAAGVGVRGDMATGALFFDVNADGAPDLFVGGIVGTPNRFFIANGDGTFTDRIATSGIPTIMDTFSASAADYDRDGDLDLFLAHWHAPVGLKYLWRNDGNGVFTGIDAGLPHIGDSMWDYSFTGSFSDIDRDGWLDLLVASDFGTSHVFINQHDGSFTDVTSGQISDENGMGSAVGDYDNDGDLDWFVSSIFDNTGQDNGGAWGFTGNRLYRNNGGAFEDATDFAGVREGGWGWGASFVDVDNDGWLDLFHVNGWPYETDTFLDDPARLFMNARDGTFVERSVELGAGLTGQGRGLVCFDYDRDGDVDLFITNYRSTPVLLRNDGGNDNAWITLTLRGRAANPCAIGARVTIEAGGLTQVRELTCGNNYLSQNPSELYVGLGSAERVERIRIDWPGGASTTLLDMDARQHLVVTIPPRESSAAPRALRITSAHPNPFSESVTISLEDARGKATLTVFDVHGRQVRSTSNRDAAAIEWDGRDERGRRAPAGVYWLRVSSGTGSDTRRVVLIR